MFNKLKNKLIDIFNILPDPDRDINQFNYFFIRGHMRSGTNWVGNLLNMHPRISCNGEFYFDMIKSELDKMLNTSYSLLSRPAMGKLASNCFDDLVKKCIIMGAKPNLKRNVLWYGDRTPRPLEPILLKGAPHFLIIRDGRDVLVSWAYHLLRVKLHEHPFNEYPEMLKKKMLFDENQSYFKENPGKLLDDEVWVRQVAKIWAFRMSLCFTTLDKIQAGLIDTSVHVIGYEKLHDNIEEERNKMYSFLGLDPGEAKPLNDLTAPGFKKENFDTHYRKGITGDWKNYFSKKTCGWFKKEAGETLVRLGYEEDLDWSNEIY